MLALLFKIVKQLFLRVLTQSKRKSENLLKTYINKLLTKGQKKKKSVNLAGKSEILKILNYFSLQSKISASLPHRWIQCGLTFV